MIDNVHTEFIENKVHIEADMDLDTYMKLIKLANEEGRAKSSESLSMKKIATWLIVASIEFLLQWLFNLDPSYPIIAIFIGAYVYIQ